MGTSSSRTTSKTSPEPVKGPTLVEKPILPPPPVPVKLESKISLPVYDEPTSEIKSAPSSTPVTPAKLKSPSPQLSKSPEFASVQEVAELEKEISQVLQESPVKSRQKSMTRITKESITSLPQKQLDIDGTEQLLLNEYNYFYHNTTEPKTSTNTQDQTVPETAPSPPVDEKDSDDNWEFEQKPIKGFDPEKFKAVNSRINFTGLSAEFSNDLQSSCSLPTTCSRKVSLEERPKSESERGTRELPVYDALDEALIANIEKEFVK